MAPHSQPAKPKSKSPYLLMYNALSAALWAAVLLQTVVIVIHQICAARKAGALLGIHDSALGAVKWGLITGKVYEVLERYTRLTQTLAGMEVVHSLIGIVRAPVLTTLMQVSSRFLLVWLIAYPFPQSARHSPAYSSMLLAWSFTEVIRYSYFTFSLSGLGVPRLWTWLRYNTFLVLYPLGVGSECWLIYSAIPLASQTKKEYGIALWIILAIYVPGIWVLFTHMLKQRRRVLKDSKEA